jgi:DNA-directed RNA polymerase subunit delta
MKTTISMLEEAYTIMSASKTAMDFKDLYDKVAAALEMSDDEKKARIGGFYTELTLDGRFVALTDNSWDLRARHTYDKVHIDVNDVYSDVEEGGEDEEDEEEEKEYNAAVQGKDVPAAEEAETTGEEEETDEKKPAEDDDVASLIGGKKPDEY